MALTYSSPIVGDVSFSPVPLVVTIDDPSRIPLSDRASNAPAAVAHRTVANPRKPPPAVPFRASCYSVTGLGSAAAEGGIEALAAGAALDRVRVDDGEAAAHQAIDEVDLRTAQVLQ